MTRSLVQPSLTDPMDVPHINGCTFVRNGKFGEQATGSFLLNRPSAQKIHGLVGNYFPDSTALLQRA